MGISVSKCPAMRARASGGASGDPFLATCSRIEFYEAELLDRAYNTAWHGQQLSSSSSSWHSPPDCSPPITPLYDSDDEPTEPTGVVNALAANSPPPGQKYRERSSRTPSPLPILRSLSDPPALSTKQPSNADNSSLQFYPAAAQQYLPHNTTASRPGSRHRRTHSSTTQHPQVAPKKIRSTANAVSSHLTHLAGKHGGPNGQTVVLPLSSAVIATAAAGADSTALQHLSLVSNQGSAADPNLRAYHHLHMMQQRRAQQQHHAKAACLQAQTQCGRGWANVCPAGMTEFTS